MAAAPPSLIIVGGGLAGGLAALALARWRREVRVTLVEPGASIGGNHLWSFFDADVDAAGRTLIGALTSFRWPAYDVRFPRLDRCLTEGYNSIESERLDAAVREALPESCIVQGNARQLEATSVVLEDGRRLEADAVVDARGFRGGDHGLDLAWQKFVGRSLRIKSGHGVTRPVVMDATVDQSDGYRFVYLLPFDETELFVEDTYYTDGPELDEVELSTRIAALAAQRGWHVDAVERQERGVLPVVLGGDFDRFWPADTPVARAGVRGGFFHPLTSYSLPSAVRFARWLATEAPTDRGLAAAARARAKAHWRKGAYDRLLARMLMRAAAPAERYRVLQRFYGLPEPLIARFYAGRMTGLEKLRILSGRPPVAIHRALRVLMETK